MTSEKHGKDDHGLRIVEVSWGDDKAQLIVKTEETALYLNAP
jgi:hypothetical protein